MRRECPRRTRSNCAGKAACAGAAAPQGAPRCWWTATRSRAQPVDALVVGAGVVLRLDVVDYWKSAARTPGFRRVRPFSRAENPPRRLTAAPDPTACPPTRRASTWSAPCSSRSTSTAPWRPRWLRHAHRWEIDLSAPWAGSSVRLRECTFTRPARRGLQRPGPATRGNSPITCDERAHSARCGRGLVVVGTRSLIRSEMETVCMHCRKQRSPRGRWVKVRRKRSRSCATRAAYVWMLFCLHPRAVRPEPGAAGGDAPGAVGADRTLRVGSGLCIVFAQRLPLNMGRAMSQRSPATVRHTWRYSSARAPLRRRG